MPKLIWLPIGIFKKGQILKNEKKGQNFHKKLVKITRIKATISLNISSFAQIVPKQASTKYYFLQQPKNGQMAKWPNGQMAKSFHFWQTVSKKAK